MLFTKEQYEEGKRHYEKLIADAKRRQMLRVNRKLRGRAMSGKERVAAHRLRSRDLGQIPRVRHLRVRESCRYNLLRFGLLYCRPFLDHDPSERMINDLIMPLQKMILGGGNECVQFPRSLGKTTWTKIAVMWAILYGHRRFVVVVAATADLAYTIQEEIVLSFYEGEMEMLRKDFPGVSLPIVAAEGNSKKMRSVYVNGHNTGMSWRGSRFTFPSARDKDGNIIEQSGGSVFVSVGIMGSVKGAVSKKDRPDLIILDDPQNRKIALSPTECDKVENIIDGDLVGLQGQTKNCSVLMSITPIKVGDVASRYADRRRHPEFFLAKSPYVIHWTDRAEQLLTAYREAWYEDNQTGDFTWELSTKFYIDHKSEFEGVEVIDPNNYVNGKEIDAIHHLLNMRCKVKDDKFLAEYMLDVSGEVEGTALSADDVMTNLTGAPRGVLPVGTVDCVAFVDVNTAKNAGLRYEVKAFGPDNISATIDYGSWPSDGRAIVPPKTDMVTARTLIKNAILNIIKDLITKRFTRQSTGEMVHPIAIWLDGGYEQDLVDSTLSYIQHNVDIGGVHLAWSIGRSWSQFGKKDRGEENPIARADHIYRSMTITIDQKSKTKRTKKFFVVHSDYWREVAQRAYLRRYPAPGSCGLFGKIPAVHQTYADEVTYERLISSGRDERSGKMKWDWYNAKKGHNHHGDTNYGCFAMAAWYKLFSARAKKIIGSDDDNHKQRFRKVKSKSKPNIFRTIKRPR